MAPYTAPNADIEFLLTHVVGLQEISALPGFEDATAELAATVLHEAARLARAREESLAELLGDWWGPDRPTDLAQLIHELNDELCGASSEQPHKGQRPQARQDAQPA